MKDWHIEFIGYLTAISFLTYFLLLSLDSMDKQNAAFERYIEYLKANEDAPERIITEN